MKKSKKNSKINVGLIVMIFITIISFIFNSKIFGESSVFNKSISNNEMVDIVYQKIPSLIKSIRIITIAWLLNKGVVFALKALMNNSRSGGTIVSLLGSSVKYVIGIAAVLSVITAWGADVSSLIAGLGILALVIGLGAQGLISDIIAGIFIVFESKFKVGDIVIIDGWKGTVTEIGLRSTKIVSISGDVKTVDNSQISSVVNLSEKISAVACTLDIDYNEDLEKVEKIINANLEGIQSRIPKIVNKILYLGVCGLGVNYMSLLIIANCEQKDYEEVERNLMRELKLMIDKNGIKKPKPTMYFSKDVTNM